MDTIGAEEIFISECDGASKPPETTSSSIGAKDNKTSIAAAYARAFAASISVHPFKTRDEFLSAMMEDVSEWLNALFGLSMKSSELMFHLETGVLLCRLANTLDRLMTGDEKQNSESPDGRAVKTKDERELTSAIQYSVGKRPLAAALSGSGTGAVVFRENAARASFQSRDNISNFLNWCRNRLKLADTVLFETEDLVAGRNERNVILCLLEVARHGSRHGMPVPELIELESEIDAELGCESAAEDGDEVERLRQEEEEEEEEEEEKEERRSGTETEQAIAISDLDRICDAEGSVVEDKGVMTIVCAGGRKGLEPTTCGTTPSPRARFCMRIHDMLRMRDRRPEIHRMKETIQIDMLTLDELVRRFLGNCRCPHQYPMIKISEGKYRIGENLMLIFVRLLRNHVMLRIGGGWETLADYLSRHDPCRTPEQNRKKEKTTHENEETMLLKSETTPTDDKNTPEKDQNTLAEDKNTPETDQSTLAEDKNTPEKDQNTLAEAKNAPATDKNTPENDETPPAEDKNTSQGKHSPEKDEDSPTENRSMPAKDEATQENEEIHKKSEDAK